MLFKDDFILTSSLRLPILCSSHTQSICYLFHKSWLFLSLCHFSFLHLQWISLSLGSSPFLTPYSPLKFKSTFKAQLIYQFRPAVSWICQVRTNHLLLRAPAMAMMLEGRVILQLAHHLREICPICPSTSFLHPTLYGWLAWPILVSVLALASVWLTNEEYQ